MATINNLKQVKETTESHIEGLQDIMVYGDTQWQFVDDNQRIDWLVRDDEGNVVTTAPNEGSRYHRIERINNATGFDDNGQPIIERMANAFAPYDISYEAFMNEHDKDEQGRARLHIRINHCLLTAKDEQGGVMVFPSAIGLAEEVTLEDGTHTLKEVPSVPIQKWRSGTIKGFNLAGYGQRTDIHMLEADGVSTVVVTGIEDALFDDRFDCLHVKRTQPTKQSGPSVSVASVISGNATAKQEQQVDNDIFV